MVCCVVFLASIIEALLNGTALSQALLDPRTILVYLIAVAHIVFCKVIDNEWLDALGHIYVVLLQIVVAVVA
jgi:hypothetical protein